MKQKTPTEKQVFHSSSKLGAKEKAIAYLKHFEILDVFIEAIDIAIEETTKEIFEDIDKLLMSKDWENLKEYNRDSKMINKYSEIKRKWLE